MLMQVHDELLLECPQKELEKVRELLEEEMESAADLRIPLAVDSGFGDNWMELK